MNGPKSILVRGWRFIPHSYAVVNQFQCLALMRQRPDVRLYFEDAPCFQPHWMSSRGLFPHADEEAIASLGPLPNGVYADVEFRIAYPYDITRTSRASRLFVFGTAEVGKVPDASIAGNLSIRDAMEESRDVKIVTPSNWSRQGFIASGAPPERVVVVPHGVDEAMFRPPSNQERNDARREMRLADDFVFLHLGAMTVNKGVGLLLSAFARVIERHPRTRLILKGLDGLYASNSLVKHHLDKLTQSAAHSVIPRLIYSGHAMPFAMLARLYHAANCYVSPYLAEGFNLPVLEAVACGLPVICTAGGPTDDFVTRDFAMRIPSTIDSTPDGSQILKPDEDALIGQMNSAIENPDLRRRANQAGPAYVRTHFTWNHAVKRLLEVMSR